MNSSLRLLIKYFVGVLVLGFTLGELVDNLNDCFEILNRSNIQVNNTIENKGFHRILNIEIKLEVDNSDFINNYCKFLIVQSFNTNAYVDEFELKQNSYNQNFLFYLSTKVNTEAIEYRSEPFELYLILRKNTIKCDEVSQKFCHIFLKFPFHLRYHKIATQQIYSNFSISNPRLLTSKCSHENEKQKNYIHSGSVINNNRIGNLQIGKCLWNELSVKNLNEKIDIQVPVGNKEQENIILGITLVYLILLASKISHLIKQKSIV